MNCMPCVSGQHSPEEVLSRQLSKQLKEWHREEKSVIKLLLLGTGESGKSTLTKQMKIKHIDGFRDSERLERVGNIRKNLRDAILSVVGAMSLLGIPLADSDLQPAVDYLMEQATADEFDCSQEFYSHVERLWQDPGVQQCHSRSNEYQLIDSAKYFLDRTATVRRPDYLPSTQDILRCRMMTNAIQKIDFVAPSQRGKDVHFSVFDVGGQQGERRKWIQVFDVTTAILFVVDSSSYDLSLREDRHRNRLVEAVEIFEQVWNNRWLQNISIILFINKIDLLHDKVLTGNCLDDLVDRLLPGSPYHERFNEFHSFCPKEDEKREFVDAFPREMGRESKDNGSSSFFGRKRSRTKSVDDMNPDVIKTAVFIKHLFMSLVKYPVSSQHQASWHQNHKCEYFYTCAIDTRTVSKVLDGCQNLIIAKVFDAWGLH